MRSSPEVGVLANVGEGEQTVLEGKPFARVTEKGFPQNATVFFFHRNTMHASSLLEFTHYFFLDLANNKLWHSCDINDIKLSRNVTSYEKRSVTDIM
ncbi:MAG TPA: hypothetical protein VMZ27_16100 [Candidatus Saccharimonadales bacterium]|nr:hypothetical protein [Candidatus Saccharimonadales bacterium]